MSVWRTPLARLVFFHLSSTYANLDLWLACLLLQGSGARLER